MFEINADIEKNRLIIYIDGTISIHSVEKYNKAMKEAIAALKPGFTALLDLQKALVFDMETIKQYQNSKYIAVSSGLKKSAMVIKSQVLKMQMNRIYGEIGIKDETFTDMDEAIKYLDEDEHV